MNIVTEAEKLFSEIKHLPKEQRIDTINQLKILLHQVSPFKKEPVDCVVWIKSEDIVSNDYNPNKVAPPEMKLLEHSIKSDGYTQPIVAWPQDMYNEVVDGFHRYRVGTESEAVKKRTLGYLPVTTINKDRRDRSDRMSSTIRHNRARGKHSIDGMQDIVIELKRRNWTDKRIASELGMESDEVLRLCQINGLIEAFADIDFSKAWEPLAFTEDSLEGDVLTDE